MPTLVDLTNASGFALFAFACFVIAIGTYRQWIVPGWIYKAEVDRRTKAESELAASTVTIAALTSAIRDGPPYRSPRAR